MSNPLDVAMRKIDMCIDYQALYSMEPDFNEIGLTVQTTSNNRMILCKIKNNLPLAESIITDYIYIGSLDTATNEISERAAEKIKAFVQAASGQKSEIKNIARDWRNGLRMYGDAVRIEEGTYEGKGEKVLSEERMKVIKEGKKYPMTEG